MGKEAEPHLTTFGKAARAAALAAQAHSLVCQQQNLPGVHTAHIPPGCMIIYISGH